MDEPDEPHEPDEQSAEDGPPMEGMEGMEGKVRGEEMFRRVLQLYALANPHDYFKNGRWQLDVMEVDLALLEAHRKEASAPEPTPLEDVILPDDMPKENGVKRLWTPALNSIQVARQNGVATNARGMSAATAAIKPIPIQIKPANTLYRPAVKAKATAPFTNLTSAGGAAPNNAPYQPRTSAIRPASAGPLKAGRLEKAAPRAMSVSMKSTTAELEKIDEFISKHGLVPVLAKVSLAKLPAPKRQWVLANYDGSTTLEEFISSFSETPSPASPVFQTLASKPKATAKPTNPASLLGPLKRPLLQSVSTTGTGTVRANGMSSPYRPLLGPPGKVPKLGSAPRLSSTSFQAAPKLAGFKRTRAEEPGSLIRSILDCKSQS